MSIQDAIRQAVREGVSDACSDITKQRSARSRLSHRTSTVLLWAVRAVSLLLGLFLLVASMGGLLAGDTGAAVIPFLVGAACASVFVLLRR